MAAPIASKSLEELFSAMPTGSLDRAILNNLRGINHRQIPGMLPSNKDMPGLTFFTRPQLNMQRDNLRNVRQLSQLLSSVPTSMQTYMRCMLDPRLQNGFTYGGDNIPGVNCPLVDTHQAFIPILTNNCLSQSGWPSISTPTFSSKAGLYNESFSMVDGRVLNNEAWDLNVNFRNTKGDPILYLFYIWVLYSSMVFEGKLVPYLDMITENEIDYNTRIYRLVLDYKKQKVTKIAACHAAFPIGVPVGDPFNDGGGQTYSDANKEIGMTFRCMGVDYFDDILVKEFNDTTVIFNPDMADEFRDSTMMSVPMATINYFNHQGYPRINPFTAKLEWFVPIEVYNRVGHQVLSQIEQDDSSLEEGE